MKTLSPAQRRQGHRCPRAPAGGAPHARGGRGRGPSNAAEEEEEDESRELRFEGAGDLQFCRTRPPVFTRERGECWGVSGVTGTGGQGLPFPWPHNKA